MHHAYDTMFENSDGFPFVVGGSPANVTAAHPSPIQIFQLWQIYINNVNPLLKITHTPTLQAQIISAGANTARIPKPLEALMFSIYFAAITSLTEQEVQSTFAEDRAVLLGKYHNATQQALVNAGFMRSDELAVMQAMFLYLVTPPTSSCSWLCTNQAPSSVPVRMSIPGLCSPSSVLQSGWRPDLVFITMAAYPTCRHLTRSNGGGYGGSLSSLTSALPRSRAPPSPRCLHAKATRGCRSTSTMRT